MTQVDSKEAVESFLFKAQGILNDKNFDITKNFYFQRLRRNYSGNNLYTNEDTLIELNYGASDIIEEIKQLTIEHYKETFIDDMPGRVNPFYCFIKTINEKLVYIKFKISEVKNKQVFCVSFHFAEYEVKNDELPYKD